MVEIDQIEVINLEIEKGMYIRFNGFISKIGHINTSKKGNTYVQFKQPNGLLAHTRIENIDRASFNIIDLIEVGDYVNGKEVSDVMKNNDGDVTDIAYTEEVEGQSYSLMPIKKIVTKEQFNSMLYEVK